MTDASNDKRNFFVSFNQVDRAWATWIAWVLEEKGYSVFFQDWDFRGSFIEQMHQASLRTERTLVVLSDKYLRSEYARSEAWAALARDPSGCEDRVVTIKVGPTRDLGLFSHFAYLDLTASAEADAERLLIERAKQSLDPTYRPKPATRPHFPGQAAPKPPFPAPAAGPALAVHNLPPFNPDFVGREQVLVELRHLLTSAPGPAVLSQAISGLGGIGKTQTALAYCYRHLADYELVWWLRAETKATLAADFTTLAEPLGLDPAAAGQAKLITSIRAALQARAGWLLVFDNVEKPVLPSTFLPSTGKGHALITSRRRDWHGIARALPLEVMPEPEALQLLTSRPAPEALPADEFAEAKTLVSELGHLPLALAQARAYMAETGMSLADYRRLLQASRPAVLARGRAGPGYPASAAKTWQISIKAAGRACAAARPLPELLAFFSADPLPMAVLGAEPAALPVGLRDELERDEAVAALHRFSLIRAEAGSIAVHRLVQAVTRDGLKEAAARTCAEATVQLIDAALPTSPQEHTNWPAFGALLPHALATAEAAVQLDAGLEAAARVFNQTAVFHYSRAAYAEAEPLYQRALAIFEQVLGPEHPYVARSLHDLAALYHAQGRHAEAEPLLKRSLAIREKALGPEHPDVAWSLQDLGRLYHAQGHYAEAEPLLKRSLAIREKALGPEHPDVAWSLQDLGRLYRAQGRYAEAEPLYQRALAIFEQVLGLEDPAVARSLQDLGECYHAQGRHAEAEPLLERALMIRKKVLGPKHPDVAWSLNTLAALYHAQCRFAEAEPLLKHGLNLFEETLRPEDPDVAWSLHTLAALYHAQGRYTEAEPLLKRAQTIRERALGLEHPALASGLHALATLYHAQGGYTKAEPLLERALTIREKALGLEHPDVAWSLQDLGRLYHAQGRFAEAEPLLKRSLKLFEKMEHPAVARSLQDLGEFYHAQGRFAEAEPLLKRSLAIREKALGLEHPDVAWSLHALAVLYHAQGRYTEAEPLLKRAVAISGKTLPPNHPDLMTFRKNYADLLDQLGRHDEAAALRAQTQAGRGDSPSGRQHGPGLET